MSTANPTIWHDNAERTIHTVNCKAFTWQSAGTPNRVIVDSNCRVLAWMKTENEFLQDYDGGFFTDVHQLRADVVKRILQLDGVR